MSATVDLEVSWPLNDCFQHSETICVRECCGIDAISDDPERVAQWGRTVGYKIVQQALSQVQLLIAQVEDRTQKVCVSLLIACATSDITRVKLLSFLQAFQDALRSRPMNEMLTRAEMEAEFDGEWVAANPEADKNLNVLGGKMIAHRTDRDAVYERAIEIKPGHSAYLYFGKMPEHTWPSGWHYFGNNE